MQGAITNASPLTGIVAGGGGGAGDGHGGCWQSSGKKACVLCGVCVRVGGGRIDKDDCNLDTLHLYGRLLTACLRTNRQAWILQKGGHRR